MEPQHQAAWAVAVAAAVLSFISPCVLPLIPGYLSMISGLSMEQLAQRRAAHLLRISFSCLLFGLGFSVVFVLVGLSVGAVGQWLQSRETIVNIVLGAIVIFFGLFVMGVVRLPFLYRDRRLRINRASLGMWGAPLLGFAFGFGWTPCLSPQLGMLLSLGARQPPPQSALLFALFGATLTLCFLAAGLLFASALRAFAFLQRHYRIIEIISGGLLVLIGLLLVTQQWDRAAAWLMRLVEGQV
jgi:cytochrome c-type biogenesis protein